MKHTIFTVLTIILLSLAVLAKPCEKEHHFEVLTVTNPSSPKPIRAKLKCSECGKIETKKVSRLRVLVMEDEKTTKQYNYNNNSRTQKNLGEALKSRK